MNIYSSLWFDELSVFCKSLITIKDVWAMLLYTAWKSMQKICLNINCSRQNTVVLWILWKQFKLMLQEQTLLLFKKKSRSQKNTKHFLRWKLAASAMEMPLSNTEVPRFTISSNARSRSYRHNSQVRFRNSLLENWAKGLEGDVVEVMSLGCVMENLANGSIFEN